MTTQYYTASSLDGFIATDDHSLEWLFPLGDINDTSYPTFFQDVGALAMGASTYEWMLRHVVKPGTPQQAAWPYAQPTWVFSHRELPRVPQAALHFVQGDVSDAGLLDEIWVQVGSVTLGSGKPLLPRRIVSPSLQLQGVRFVGPGFAELRYSVPAAR